MIGSLLNGGRNRLIESDGDAAVDSTISDGTLTLSLPSNSRSAVGSSITLSGSFWIRCLIGLSSESVRYRSTRFKARRPSRAYASARTRSVTFTLL
ncbi:hypothetical protein OGATHE_005545 [Ogataea polymorpha]|uniref:Uncharacterized protein n=1 Tax=Ogataea polymorpha TaxID=460523 RepID=A0A9P8NU00_9ASCO|nr:hypothetical protein OGATHE_005545 [Ogataea polymorpha]